MNESWLSDIKLKKEEEKKKKYSELFEVIKRHIYNHYRICDIKFDGKGIFTSEYLIIEGEIDDNLIFKLILVLYSKSPSFELFVKEKRKKYNFKISDDKYNFFKKFLIDDVSDYPRRKEEVKRKRIEEKERIEKERLEEEKNKNIFNELKVGIIKYIVNNYDKCKISIPKVNFLIIEKNDLSVNNTDIDFKVTLNNTINNPTFIFNVKYGKKDFNYEVSGQIYISFKSFIINNVYEYYKHSEYKHSEYTHSQSNKPYESEDIKNKRRKFNILRDNLKSHQDNMKKIENWKKLNPGKIHTDEEVTKNQILAFKRKIDQMKNDYKFENKYQFVHLNNSYLLD